VNVLRIGFDGDFSEGGIFKTILDDKEEFCKQGLIEQRGRSPTKVERVWQESGVIKPMGIFPYLFNHGLHHLRQRGKPGREMKIAIMASLFAIGNMDVNA
jgi:hypothetical protein